MSIVVLARINHAYSRKLCIEKRKVEIIGFETVNFDI